MKLTMKHAGRYSLNREKLSEEMVSKISKSQARRVIGEDQSIEIDLDK